MAEMRNAEAEAARQRVTPDMTIREILTRLVENGVKVYDVKVEALGEVVLFVGTDAARLRALALETCYGSVAHAPEKP